MAYTPEELYELYLHNNPEEQRLIETISITHSEISQDYYIVREPDGETLFLEDGTEQFFQGVNFEVSKSTDSDDLDEEFSIVFDDADGTLKNEASRITISSSEFPVVTYRAYIDSDVSSPAYGPIKLQGTSMTAGNDGQVTVTAKSPSLNVNRCGELYTYERFSSLKSFL